MRLSRRLVLFALASLLGSSCVSRSERVDEVLVEGDGIRITKADFDAYLAQVPPFARQEYSDEQLLDHYIKGELMYVDALRKGLDRDPKTRRAIDLAVKQLIQREYLRREIDEKMGIDDAQVRAYYEAHLDEFRAPPQRKCWHILTRTAQDAERARQAILSGEPFRDVAMRFSIDDLTREQGGRIGVFSKEEAPALLKARPALVETLFALAPGHVSTVVQSDLGFHVLKAHPAKRMPYLPLESVARQVRERMLVPDSAVARFYEEQRETFRSEDRAQIRLLVVPTRAEAERLRERIASGADMDSLARAVSIDPRTASRGGLTDWLRRGVSRADIAPEVQEAMWDVPQGELGPIVHTAKGYTVFRVEGRDYTGFQPLEEVRERIRTQLLVKAKEEAKERSFQELRRRYRIVVRSPSRRAALKGAPEGGGTGAASRAAMNDEELFALAGSEPVPAKRLEIYRGIVHRFPTAERADDSQFMIAFVLMEELRDTAGAIEAYEELIRRYPRSDWVDDAQAMLEVLRPSQESAEPSGDAGTNAANAGDPNR